MRCKLLSGDRLADGITLTSVKLKAPPVIRSSLTIADALRLGVTDANAALVGKIVKLPPLICLFNLGEFDRMV